MEQARPKVTGFKKLELTKVPQKFDLTGVWNVAVPLRVEVLHQSLVQHMGTVQQAIQSQTIDVDGEKEMSLSTLLSGKSKAELELVKMTYALAYEAALSLVYTPEGQKFLKKKDPSLY